MALVCLRCAYGKTLTECIGSNWRHRCRVSAACLSPNYRQGPKSNTPYYLVERLLTSLTLSSNNTKGLWVFCANSRLPHLTPHSIQPNPHTPKSRLAKLHCIHLLTLRLQMVVGISWLQINDTWSVRGMKLPLRLASTPHRDLHPPSSRQRPPVITLANIVRQITCGVKLGVADSVPKERESVPIITDIPVFASNVFHCL